MSVQMFRFLFIMIVIRRLSKKYIYDIELEEYQYELRSLDIKDFNMNLTFF